MDRHYEIDVLPGRPAVAFWVCAFNADAGAYQWRLLCVSGGLEPDRLAWTSVPQPAFVDRA